MSNTSGTNPVAAYAQSNFTIQDPAAYKSQIDANFMMMQRIANQFAPRAQRTPSMKVEVDPGCVFDGTTLTEVGGYCYATATTLSSNTVPVSTTVGFANGMIFDSADGWGGQNSQTYDSVTISSFTATQVVLSAGSNNIQNNAPMVARQITGAITAPVTHPRIDRIVGDQITGLISVVGGTEATTPSPPAIPAGKFPIAQVLLQTSSTSITNAMIFDERALRMDYGRLVNIQRSTTTGSQTYTPTHGIRFAIIELQASGGASGSTTGAGGQSACGGPGGGGAFLRLFVTAADLNAATVTIVLGAKGAKAAAGNNAGGDGTDTTISVNSSTTTVGAGKGGGAKTASASAQVAGTPGAGGANTIGSHVTVLDDIPGQAGGYGFSNGSTTIINLPPPGGDSHKGRGGESNINAAVAGYKYGGGASGLYNASGSNQQGADGADPEYVIYEYA